jgi:hypothetical protein
MKSELATKLYGVDLFSEPIREKVSGLVASRFGFPPFSVLDARSGDWQRRKRAWISIGIRGEIGRGFVRPHGKDTRPVGYNWNTEYTGGDCWRGSNSNDNAASVFDPVLCECMYRWFVPSGGQVVDPFAGGSVRGIVAGCLGLKYWGCDLRQEQVDANYEQGKKIELSILPNWVCGDSLETLPSAPETDFLFTCPPYGDLERYSDNPRDLSTMERNTFETIYSQIIFKAIQRLKSNRFVCFVVGDFRDKRGYYRDFVSTTIAAFRNAKCELYNEAILVTSIGSGSMRVTKQFTKQFEASRKFVKTHQNVLIFCKGDWRQAMAAINEWLK